MLIVICIGLFVAGTVADWLVVRATRHDPEAGLIAGLVAAGLGALVTVGIAVVAGVLLSGLALTLYLVATTPLVVGSLVRIVRAYRETHEAQRLVIASQLAAMDRLTESTDGNCPKPGGYLDGQALTRAAQANAAARRIIGDLLQGGSQQRQLQLLLQLTYEMGEQNHALHEMRRIRQRVAGGQTPAESTEDTDGPGR